MKFADTLKRVCKQVKRKRKKNWKPFSTFYFPSILKIRFCLLPTFLHDCLKSVYDITEYNDDVISSGCLKVHLIFHWTSRHPVFQAIVQS